MVKPYRNMYGWSPNVRGSARLIVSSVWECQLERTRPDLKRGALERVGRAFLSEVPGWVSKYAGHCAFGCKACVGVSGWAACLKHIGICMVGPQMCGAVHG